MYAYAPAGPSGRGHHALCVGREHGRLVGVGAVGNHLYGRFSRWLAHGGGKVGAEHERHAYLSTAEKLVDACHCRRLLDYGKPLAGPESLLYAQRPGVFRCVEHSHARVVKLGLDGVSQGHHQHERHGQQYEQRAPVAEYLQKLFLDE